MADTLTRQERSRRMASVRHHGTTPELQVRRLLHSAGLRFRLVSERLPVKPDIVLPRWKTVVLVHGCFWHGHCCPLFRLPGTNTKWWKNKIDTNIARDRRSVERLLEEGWRVVTVWQCALKGTTRLGAEELQTLLLKSIRGSAPAVEVSGRLASTRVR